MNARGALVGFMLAGFALLALSSITPRDEAHPTGAGRAARIEVAPAPTPGAADYAIRERSGERASF